MPPKRPLEILLTHELDLDLLANHLFHFIDAKVDWVQDYIPKAQAFITASDVAGLTAAVEEALCSAHRHQVLATFFTRDNYTAVLTPEKIKYSFLLISRVSPELIPELLGNPSPDILILSKWMQYVLFSNYRYD